MNRSDDLLVCALFGAFFAVVIALALWGFGLPTNDTYKMFAIMWVVFTLICRWQRGR